MVADAYDALTSKRPYRSPVTYQVAAEIIAKDDSHFDPSVVATFLAIPPEKLRKIAGHATTMKICQPECHDVEYSPSGLNIFDKSLTRTRRDWLTFMVSNHNIYWL